VYYFTFHLFYLKVLPSPCILFTAIQKQPWKYA
jgi:hypothetical protein